LEEQRIVVQSVAVMRDYSLSLNIQATSGSRYSCTLGLVSPGVKWPGCEAHHSLCDASIRNVWIYTSTPSHAFMVWMT